ncbi:LacI family DNA-binding transcriptional regulator [Bifidobacterium sp. MA2]|uniref:LacI family DNA-binding transcriptional regulator n=1 Tax=Bifidobacterium santillanense TaxID=2809028 RepID=A0ABS5UPI3_9BIFI|nr:LacI family DNA-binding transcriptional regulator [Bifidobacterium santillanense]MBT1172738.1 LacI family DNA-binding transcriptional regulator [Bifidobacterium santillanense]
MTGIPTPGPHGRGGVTLKDVAKAAGVSVSTASRALAGNTMIGAETRARVLRTARRLNYVANGLAQSMAGGGMRTLAFITNAFLGEPFARIAYGVDDVARENHAVLLTNSAHEDMAAEWETIALLARQRVAGVLLVGSRTTSPEYRTHLAACRDLLASVGARLVMCGSPRIPGLDDIPTVAYEQRDGARRATEALLQAGHRRIAFLGYDERSTARERFAGFRDALASAGLYADPRSALVTHSDNRGAALDAAVGRLLTMPDGRRPTAVVCVTDFAAYRVYSAARSLGLRIPEDLSVTGFDDLSGDDALLPRLSSVRVPYERIGERAAALALDAPTTGSDDSNDCGGRTIHPVFPVEFVARESIAPTAV